MRNCVVGGYGDTMSHAVRGRPESPPMAGWRAWYVLLKKNLGSDFVSF